MKILSNKSLFFIAFLFSINTVLAQFPSNCDISDMYIILSEENSPYSSMVVKFDTKADVTSTSCLGNQPSGEGVVVTDHHVYIARRTFPTPESVIDVYNTNTGTLESTITFPPTLTSNPHDLAISPDGSTLYAAFTESTTAGQYYGVFRAINATTGNINYSFNFPINNRIWGITVDPSGNIYVTKMIQTTPKIMQLIKIDPITYNQTILFSQNDPTTMTPPASGFLGIAYYPTTNSLWAYAPYYNINGVMMNFSLSGTLLSTCVVESGVQPVKYGPDGLIYTGSLNANTCVGQFNPNTCAYSTYVPQPPSGGASTKGLAFACASQVFCIPQTCSVSQITATPGSCNSTNNQYNVTGSITFSNPPSSGTLTVSVGAITQTFTAPFTSPQTYTLNGLTSDGAVHTIITHL